MRSRLGIALSVAGLLALVALEAGCLGVPPVATQAPGDAEAAAEEAPIVWAGAAPGDLYRPGEVRQFDIFQGGRLIGHSWGRYEGAAAGKHRFETRVELLVPGRPPTRSGGELVVDALGHLVRGFERSAAVQLDFERRGSTIAMTDGTKKDEVDYDPKRRDVAVMAHSVFLHEEIMFGLRELRAGEESWRLISLSGGPPAQWTGHVAAAGDVAVIDTNLGEKVTLRAGRIDRIEVPNIELDVRAVADPAWPSWVVELPAKLTYTVPTDARFTVREVELPGRAGEPALSGEILVPRGGGTGLPAVLYISGTGQEDRHGFAGPPPVDLGSHEITDAIGNAGFVVLRFDERGRGKSEPGKLSFVAQVEDARRALRTLLVQDEVDPDRIVVVGHGEGGLRALHLAVAQPKAVIGVALLASPGRPYRDVFLAQAAAALRDVPPSVRAEAGAHQQAIIDKITRGEEPPPELAAQADWIREILGVQPARLIAKTKAQLFIAQGGKDFEVDPKADVAALVRAAKKHRKRYRLRRYPDLDHLFKHEPGDSAPERYLQLGRNVDTTFLTDLVAWTKRTTKRPRN